jgi:hypothetical protein
VGAKANTSQENHGRETKVHVNVCITIPSGSTGFAEDKDAARRIRIAILLPALQRKDYVILDFSAVTYATQSFVHALLGEPLQRFGEDILSSIEFKNCTPQLQSVVQLVVDYSLGGFLTVGDEKGTLTPQEEGPKNKPSTRKTVSKKAADK